MSDVTDTSTPERPAQLPAQSPPADPAATTAAEQRAAGRLSWWRGEGGEGARRNLWLIGVLVALIAIGIVTRPDLYGNSSWVWSNILVILKLASVVGVVSVGMT